MPIAIRVTESTPGAARALLGSKLPSAAERPRRGFVFRVPNLPAFDAVVLGEDEELTIEPSDEDSDVFAPAKLLDLLVAKAPRHERSRPCADPAGLERRASLAAEWGDLDALPRRNPVDVLDLQRPGVALALRARLERLALPLNEVVAAVSRHPRVSFNEEEVTALALDVLASGALWPWDCDGVPLDEEAARNEEERIRREALAAELEAHEEAINTLTCAELGVIAIEDLRRPGAFRYFDTSSVCGLGLPTGDDYSRAVRVHPADFVPAVPQKALKQKWNFVGEWGFGEGWGSGFFALCRKSHVNRAPITVFRDESTPEGRWAKGRAEVLVAPLATRLLAGDGHVGLRLLTSHALLRGLGLRPDIAYGVLVDALEPLWVQMHPQARRPRFMTTVDEEGREQRVPAPPDPLPPMPYPLASEEQFFEVAAQVLSGASALVSPDELFGDGPPPEPVDATAGDPWREALAAFVEGKDITASADVVAHLRERGLLELGTTVRPKDHSRVFQTLRRLGFKKVDVAGDIPNTRKKAFVRMSPATPTTDGEWGDS